MRSGKISKRQQISAVPVIQISYLSLIAFFVFLLFLALFLHWGQFTLKTDTLIHDAWVRASTVAPPNDVVIIGIDSHSIEKVGRWPWPRDVQARLIGRLTEAGVKSITLDILYTEPDLQSAENDSILAKSIAESGRVILPILTGEYSGGRINPEKLPVPEMSMVVAGLGHVYFPRDSDGLVRRVNLKSGFNSAHWSAISLTTAEFVGTAPEHIPGERLGKSGIKYTWVSDYQVFIPYYGVGGTIHTISAESVLVGELPVHELNGKHAFVGVTAVGLGDIQPTPVSYSTSSISGVEVHATIFSALQRGILVTRAEYRAGYIVAVILIMTVILAYSKLSPSKGLAVSLILAFIPIMVSFVLYKYFRLWYPPLSTSIPILVSLPLWSWHRLEFISRFIQHEVDVMDRDLPPVSSSDNMSLAHYFNTAMDHLPIEGWRFESHGKVFQNGLDCIENHTSPNGEWAIDKNNFCKRYPSGDGFSICLKLSERQYGGEITNMVDSLARVRRRLKSEESLGSIEQLQVKTQKLSLHMENMRRLNLLKDSVFHGSPSGLVVWNMAGELVSMNGVALDMFPEDLSREPSFRSFAEVLLGDNELLLSEKINKVLFDKQPWQIEFNLIGKEKIIDFSVIGEQFSERLLVGSIVDVSVIRRSKRSQAEMLDYLSHDLRSPLISSIYLLSAQYDGSREIDQKSLQRIETHINQSLSMIDDLLSLSKAGYLQNEEMIPTLFDNIINNAVDRVEDQAASKSIRIKISYKDESELWVNAAIALLERALINIVGNSIKYSPKNTEIDIILSTVDNSLFCEIVDQGIGIGNQKNETLFEHFKRGKNTESNYSGVGLGLAMVSRVIEQHEGRVWAESPKTGTGTVVVIELPRLQL